MNNENDFEIHGRGLAQAMFSELEKIAYSRRVKALSREAMGKAEQHARAADAIGWRKWIPFTQPHRTTDKMRVQARAASRRVDRAIEQERAKAVRTLRYSGNPEKRENALRLLENRPKRRKPKGGRGVEVADVPEEGGTSLAQKALIGTGVVGAAAGGAVLGKRYLDKKKNEEGGQMATYRPGGTY